MQSKDGTATEKKQENAELYHFSPSQAKEASGQAAPNLRAVRDPVAVWMGFLHARGLEQLC